MLHPLVNALKLRAACGDITCERAFLISNGDLGPLTKNKSKLTTATKYGIAVYEGRMLQKAYINPQPVPIWHAHSWGYSWGYRRVNHVSRHASSSSIYIRIPTSHEIIRKKRDFCEQIRLAPLASPYRFSLSSNIFSEDANCDAPLSARTLYSFDNFWVILCSCLVNGYSARKLMKNYSFILI